MHDKLSRFVLVGILNTAFGYSMYALFLYLGCHYSTAILLATVIGVLFNFKTIGRFVFRSSDNTMIIRFSGVYLVTYLLNVAALHLCRSYNLNMYLSGMALLIPMSLISFKLNNKLVFKGNR